VRRAVCIGLTVSRRSEETMQLRPDYTATAEEAAALVVALARGVGFVPAAEIEDQAAILLGAFAQACPDHPVARFFDRGDDDQIERFLDAVASEVAMGAARALREIWLN
jgi:hypothetical protein